MHINQECRIPSKSSTAGKSLQELFFREGNDRKGQDVSQQNIRWLSRQVNVICQQPLRVLHLTMYMDKFKTGQHRTAFATAAMFFSVYHHFWSWKIAWTLMQYIKCLSLLWSLNFTKMGITSWDFNQRNRQFQTKMENNTLFERPLSADLEA